MPREPLKPSRRAKPPDAAAIDRHPRATRVLVPADPTEIPGLADPVAGDPFDGRIRPGRLAIDGADLPDRCRRSPGAGPRGPRRRRGRRPDRAQPGPRPPRP